MLDIEWQAVTWRKRDVSLGTIRALNKMKNQNFSISARYF
jgi:hypothetical protein